MGAWGTAIFSDDTAADVRGEWRDAILEGLSPEEATARIETTFSDTLSDRDDAIIFWLALAAAQMETGRLLEGVRDRALAIIDAGGDIERWREEDESLARQRDRVLQRLAQKLRGSQPKPKRMRQSKGCAVPFDIGDVVRVRDAGSGSEALLLVVDQAESYIRGQFDPVLAPLLWEGGEIPTRQELERIPFVVTDEPGGKGIRPRLIVAGTHRRDSVFGEHLGEVVMKGVRRKTPGDYRNGATHGGAVVTSWAEWPTVVQMIDGPHFKRLLELTREQ